MPEAAPFNFATFLQAFGRGFARAWQLGPAAPSPAPKTRARRARRTGERPAPAPAPAPLPRTAPPRPRSGHEIVRYRQGRGFFEARIVRFDSATKTLTLERLSDGQRVMRPASKVYPAGK